MAGGTYVCKHEFEGQTFLLLNIFHPFQLVPYTSAGRGIIVMECSSDQPWAVLRGDICGCTDPGKAKDGSIRQLFLSKKEELGLERVDTSNNGCHMSAGPLEALVELRRFLGGVGLEETLFGEQLLSAGHAPKEVEDFCGNVTLTYEGEPVTTFDLTEECDAEEALAKLKQVSSTT